MGQVDALATAVARVSAFLDQHARVATERGSGGEIYRFDAIPGRPAAVLHATDLNILLAVAPVERQELDVPDPVPPNAEPDLKRLRERSQRFEELGDKLEGGCLPGMDPRATTTALALAATLAASEIPALLDRYHQVCSQLEQIKRAGVHPGLVRWCSWPDCWQSFNAVSLTASSNAGWLRHSRTGILLCPHHSQQDHWLDFVSETNPVRVRATCSCGEQHQFGAVTLGEMTQWWRGHLRNLPRTPHPPIGETP